MITRALAVNGARRVYISGRRENVLKQAAQDVNPDVVIPLPGDVTSQESLLQMVSKVEEDVGYVNLVVANAGMMGPRPLQVASGEPLPSIADYRAHALRTPMEDFTQTYAVNATGVYYTTLAFLELLDAGNKTGNMGADWKSQVVATSSIAGFSRLKGASFAYNSSKAAVTHMMKLMATAFAPYKIRYVPRVTSRPILLEPVVSPFFSASTNEFSPYPSQRAMLMYPSSDATALRLDSFHLTLREEPSPV
jgi:diacylglycerol diphosphate phosphatase/phosphatidate phosphatase